VSVEHERWAQWWSAVEFESHFVFTGHLNTPSVH
jgi:hypothetical protein